MNSKGSNQSLSTSSYLKYIQKFRNQTSATIESTDSFINNKENLNNSSMKNLDKSYQDVKPKKYDSKQQPFAERDVNSKAKHQSNERQKQKMNAYEYQIDHSNISQDQSTSSLIKRIQTQEDQTKDLMRVIKLIQAQNESLEEENHVVKENIRLIRDSVQNLAGKSDEIKVVEEKIQEIKKGFESDLKQIGKELAKDIISLNKKLEQKNKSINEQMLDFDKKLLEINERQIKFSKAYQTFCKKETHQIDQVKKAQEDKSRELSQNFDTLTKKIQNIAREVQSNKREKKQKKPAFIISATQSLNTTDVYNSKNIDEKQLNQTGPLLDTINDPIYNKKQHEIMQRILSLEKDLLDIKNTGKEESNFNSQSMKLIENQNRLNQTSHSYDYGRNQSPDFRMPRSQKPTVQSNNKHISPLEQSLERRVSDSNISDIRSAYIRNAKKRAYQGLLDVSFSSGSTSFYYDTGKSQKQEQRRQPKIMNQKNKEPKYSQLRGQRSGSKKSLGRKSFDDILTFVNKTARKSNRSISRGPSQMSFKQSNSKIQSQRGAQFDLLESYMKQKEMVMQERAKRLMDLSNLNITQKSHNQSQMSRGRQQKTNTITSVSLKHNKRQLKPNQSRK